MYVMGSLPLAGFEFLRRISVSRGLKNLIYHNIIVLVTTPSGVVTFSVEYVMSVDLYVIR